MQFFVVEKKGLSRIIHKCLAQNDKNLRKSRYPLVVAVLTLFLLSFRSYFITATAMANLSAVISFFGQVSVMVPKSEKSGPPHPIYFDASFLPFPLHLKGVKTIFKQICFNYIVLQCFYVHTVIFLF